ncbi:MAG: radical SAM protein [Deltaproteobacteria bacterium]
MLTLNNCNLCPRECGIDRNTQLGFCQGRYLCKVARAALHFWEEPCISGTRGSGTVFFSGCNLHCCYCQNYQISSEGQGKEISTERLAETFIELQDQGAHNINLVTPTPYLPHILKALESIKPRRRIPVIYNSSGYEKVETIKELNGYIDVYLPDFKYFNNTLARKYSNVEDYFEVATAAIREMLQQTGGIAFDENGIIRKGVMIRHLVLPGGRRDSQAILNWLHENLPSDGYWLSLMSQYTPAYKSREHPEIDRRITSLEYESVVEEARRLGLVNGYIQERSSAGKQYTPPFDLEGV